MLAIAVMLAFVPPYIGAVIPTGWCVLWLVLPLLLFWIKIDRTPIHDLGLAFLCYAALSLAWSPHGLFGFMQLCALASVFIWAASLSNLRGIVIGLAIGLSVSAILSIFQFFGFRTVYVAELPAGLFVNSNVFAEVSALILILLLIYRLWWWIPATLPALLLWPSRSVVLALIGTAIVWLWSKSRLAAASLTIFGGVIAYSVTTFRAPSVDQRWDMWRDTISGLTIWGRGVGSFEWVFPYFAKTFDTAANRPQFAHNDLLQLIFEFGVGAIPLLIAIGMLFKTKDNHRYALICFGIIGLFGFPLHIPVTAFIFSIVAGRLVSVRSEFWATRTYRGPSISSSAEATSAGYI